MDIATIDAPGLTDLHYVGIGSNTGSDPLATGFALPDDTHIAIPSDAPFILQAIVIVSSTSQPFLNYHGDGASPQPQYLGQPAVDADVYHFNVLIFDWFPPAYISDADRGLVRLALQGDDLAIASANIVVTSLGG